MASGAAKVVRGATVGDGTAQNIRSVGFRPRSVKLINVTSGDEMFWQEGMADDEGFKRIAAGAGALVVSDGVIPLSDGFTLGADADMNVAAEKVLWEATE